MTTAEVYVSVETVVGLEAVAAMAGLKPVDGGRLILRPFPTVSANVQVNLEIAAGTVNAQRLESALLNAEFEPRCRASNWQQ